MAFAGRKFLKDLFAGVITLFLVLLSQSASGASYQIQNGAKVVYQPELDNAINLGRYVNDGTLFKLLIQCLLYDGPCDPVGKWMRPRMASYFLESCPLCTPNQKQEVDRFIVWLYHNHPQLFNQGVNKHLEANGIRLPEGSRFRSRVNSMHVPKVETTSSKEKTGSSEESDSPSDSSGPSKASRIAPEESLHESLKTSDNEDFVLATPGKKLSTNSRRNKFSSDSSYTVDQQSTLCKLRLHRLCTGSSASTSLFGHPQRVSHVPLPEEVEDDEAESDFEITTVP